MCVIRCLIKKKRGTTNTVGYKLVYNKTKTKNINEKRLKS